jgi:hypothetical protein
MPEIKIKNYWGECNQTKKNQERLVNGKGACGGMQACNPVFMFIVKTAILIWILCIVYILFYIIYRFVRYAYDAYYDFPDDVVRPGLYILDGFFTILCYIAFSVLWFLTGVFFIIYIVYVIFRAIGFEWLILMISPWCECKAIGLFDFFDKLAALFLAPIFINAKIKGSVIITSAYITYFLSMVVGMSLNPNYILNNEYFKAFSQLYQYNNCNLNLCPEKVAEFTKVIVEQSPIKFKVSLGDGPDYELTEMQTIEIDNCIAKNTVTLPNDASTIDKLTTIFSNEMERRKCYESIAPSMKSYEDDSRGSCQAHDGLGAPCFDAAQFSTDTMIKQGSQAVADHENNKESDSNNNTNKSTTNTKSATNTSTSTNTKSATNTSTSTNTKPATSPSTNTNSNTSTSTNSNTYTNAWTNYGNYSSLKK